MKKIIAKIIAINIIILLAVTGLFFYFLEKKNSELNIDNNIALLNEIEYITRDSKENSKASKEIDELKLQIKNMDYSSNSLLIGYVIFISAYIIFIYLYIYVKVIKPFDKLQKYASDVANGNLDVSLQYERTNFFGAFTWAFDHMREEIKRARKSEALAMQNNKTIIATLSHDIKTPIASIRAYAEGLEANIESSYDKRQRYVKVIINKCDEVTKLTNDLMLHSLSELDKLEIISKKEEISILLEETIHDLEYPYISIKKPLPEGYALIDSKRFKQVIENILNNAKKYAENTRIDIWCNSNEKEYKVHIKDHGDGILPEDMPFIFGKFYRGKNTKDKQGSGLGLYIVKYILTQMKGDIELINTNDGLEAIISLPIYSS